MVQAALAPTLVVLNNSAPAEPELLEIGKTNQLSARQRANLEAAGYRIIGKHSAVKICKYCKDSLRGEGKCYKHTFYGIESGQCIQMSPTVQFCTENCGFCWRTLRYHMSTADDWDPPELIVDGMFAAQQRLLTGFGGHASVPRERYEKSLAPKHVAISLSGEPTLYPHLPELIKCMHQRGLTTFLVTNGTNPEMLRRLLASPPTQLYITLAGASKEMHRATTNPIQPDAWERLQQSLALLSRFPRSVIRLTLVKGVNLLEPERYAALLEAAAPTFVEAKGFVAVGGSQARLPFAAMPSHADIVAFAREIEAASSYRLALQQPQSRCVLLTRPGTERPHYGIGDF